MSAWPDLTEYHEAVQHPGKAFADSALKVSALEQDRFGMPKPATGGNAVVYKGLQAGGFFSRKRTWAIRCFLRPISDHAERYEAISKHLKKSRFPYGVAFDFLKQGIQIRKNWFPLVKMQWVEGDLFHDYVEKNINRPDTLASLRDQWLVLVRTLEYCKVAHGDLQHGNIMVRGGNLFLIDYDGMWVPKLKGRKAAEGGHRAYQHPRREDTDFGLELDRFSALIIYLSLAGLEKNPKLWDDHHTGDNLIFVREDFLEPGRSALWKSLQQIDSPLVEGLTNEVLEAIGKAPMEVPELAMTLKNLATAKTSPKGSPTVPPPAAAKPTPAVAKPAPVAAKPTPAAAKPAPVATKPAPAAAKPAPAAAKPAPAAVKPAPAAAKPAPAPAKPAPAPAKPASGQALPSWLNKGKPGKP